MKTADLVAGPQTDALVALSHPEEDERFGVVASLPSAGIPPQVYENGDIYSPSSTRAQWAELIEKFYIDLYNNQEGVIEAVAWAGLIYGASAKATADTYGLAICKAVIAAKWGGEIPDEIWEKVK